MTSVIAFLAAWCAVSILATLGFHVCKCTVRIVAQARHRHHRLGAAIPSLQAGLVADSLPSTRRFERRPLTAAAPRPTTRALR